ncbi:UNVERIFIED_CONTAM: hypothetical protein K2H54_064219 [Gekko kuhli]
MAPNTLGVYWQDEEVDLLLEILLEIGAGAVVMPSGRLPNAELFSKAARRLTAAGYPRSSEQCRAKFKRLKASFFEALEKWGGIPPKKKRPLFFQPLFRLWEQAKRPSWLHRRAAEACVQWSATLQRMFVLVTLALGSSHPVFRWHQERERAMKEAESEHQVSSTDSQQDNSSTVNLEIIKMEDETPQMDMALPTESEGRPPLQGDSSIDKVIIVKEEDEAPQMEMVLPTELASPLLQDNTQLEATLKREDDHPSNLGMFVSIPCTAAVVGSSAQVEQSNRATQTILAEDMYHKVEKLELSLHQATQITRLEQEIAQRENNCRTRVDRLEEDSEKMYREIGSLRQCLQKLSHPSEERRQL